MLGPVPGLFACGQARGLDVAQLPGQQDADERQDQNPTRNASARAMWLVLALPSRPSFIMKKSAVPRLPRMATNANATRYVMGGDYPVTPARLRSPRFWLITLAALAAMLATLSLGFWQLSRASQKEALQAATDARKGLPALDNTALAAIKNVADELHRPVRLQGRWLPQHSVYLDNRQMNGKPGFHVLTPLVLDGSGVVVLVQRGWVPRNFVNREQLPAVQSPTGVVGVEGRLAAAPPRLYEFQGAAPAPGSSVIRQNLDLAAFRRRDPPAAGALHRAAAWRGVRRPAARLARSCQRHRQALRLRISMVRA